MNVLLGRRTNPNNVLHLMDKQDPLARTWLTLCGRKIRAKHALASEKFVGGEGCCTVCQGMQARALKSAAVRAALDATASLAS